MEDFETIGLLTQLIEPKSERRIGPSTINNTTSDDFKQTFLEIILLDRARAHQDALKSSKTVLINKR